MNTAKADFCTLARASGTRASNCPAGPSTFTGAPTSRTVWANPDLVCRRSAIPPTTPATEAGRFIRTLAAKLGLTDQYVQAAYEDTWYYLWRERRLPVNVDPFNSKLDDAMERARLRRRV